jgi:hypothetical protein
MKAVKSISIEQVEEHFLNWRQYPIKTRIPDELWMAACYLTQRFSVAYVCKKLSLNTALLRRKMASIQINSITDDDIGKIQW